MILKGKSLSSHNNDNHHPLRELDNARLWSLSDLTVIRRRLRKRKPPSPHEVETEIMTTATLRLLAYGPDCLEFSVFPRIWKVGTIIALVNSDKDLADLRSYRAICLLSVLGKVLERLMFGFRAGLSTDNALYELRQTVQDSQERHAIAIVFDMKGAFDKLRWTTIKYSLARRRSPRNLELWDTSEKGKLTYEFMPDICSWISLDTPPISHSTLQFINGHGDFREKLHGFSLTDFPLFECGEIDNTTRVLFDCLLAETHRQLLRSETETKNGHQNRQNFYFQVLLQHSKDLQLPPWLTEPSVGPSKHDT